MNQLGGCAWPLVYLFAYSLAGWPGIMIAIFLSVGQAQNPGGGGGSADIFRRTVSTDEIGDVNWKFNHFREHMIESAFFCLSVVGGILSICFLTRWMITYPSTFHVIFWTVLVVGTLPLASKHFQDWFYVKYYRLDVRKKRIYMGPDFSRITEGEVLDLGRFDTVEPWRKGLILRRSGDVAAEHCLLVPESARELAFETINDLLKNAPRKPSPPGNKKG